MSLDASLPTICAACRKPGALHLEQALVKGQLTWLESFACACGHGFEAKNAGLPMPAARQALMVAHGKYRVFVDALPKDGKAFQVLGAVLDVPEAEVAAALAKLPALVWEGTKAEGEFMQQALTKAGATVRNELVGAKPPAPRASAKRPARKK
jgi:hypothetical protein